MSEETAEKKAKIRHSDTFSIDPSNLEKVRRITDALAKHCQAANPSRKQIINWIIERFPEELGPADLKELSTRYYDEERFLRTALTEVRAAKARGERMTLESILERHIQGGTVTPRRTRRKKEEAAGVEQETKSESAAHE